MRRDDSDDGSDGGPCGVDYTGAASRGMGFRGKTRRRDGGIDAVEGKNAVLVRQYSVGRREDWTLKLSPIMSTSQ